MHTLFKNVNYKDFKHLYTIKNFKKGSIVFNEGDICNEIGLIINGEVHISTLTNNDKEYIISILKDNDIFGENLLFNDNKEYFIKNIKKEEFLDYYQLEKNTEM